MSKILMNQQPLVILPELAQLLGLNEAIFLQQLHYWLEGKDAHYRDGKFWVYNTYKNWKEDNFPFWSPNTIKRIADNLIKFGLIEKTNKYNSMKQDNTLWFTINYEALKPYEEEADRLYKEKQEKKLQKRIEKRRLKEATLKAREMKKLENEKNQSKNDLKSSKIESNQNGETDYNSNVEPSKIESNQNGETISPKCIDHLTKMVRAIPDTTTETNTKYLNTTTVECLEKKDNIVNSEENNVVVKSNVIKFDLKNSNNTTKKTAKKTITNEDLQELKKIFKLKYDGDLDTILLKNLIDLKGVDTVKECINEFGKYVTNAKKVEKLFHDFTKKYGTNEAYKLNTKYKNLSAEKPIQMTNYEQRPVNEVIPDDFEEQYFKQVKAEMQANEKD